MRRAEPERRSGRSPEAIGVADIECESADGSAVVCEYCGRPFADEQLRTLHRGHVHGDTLTDDERVAFEAAYEREQETIRLFRLKALGTLVLLYFGFLMVYAFV